MSGSDKPTRIRYAVLPLLAFAAASAYLTRHGLAVANTTMQEELHFNNEQFGYLYSAFSIGYLICQMPVGWIGQKIGTRITLPGLSAIWSLTTLVTAAVSSLGALIATRFVFGLAQAGLMPNAAAVIRDWFPVRFRGTASSILTMAMSLGGVITMALTAWLLNEYSWRDIFRGYSMVGIVWAILFCLVFRTRPQDHPRTNDAECELISYGEEHVGQSARFHWPSALCDVSTWALCGQLLFKAAGYNFFVTFFPAFLEFKYEITKASAGLLTTWPLMGVIAGSLFGGVIVDQVYTRTGSKRLSRCGVAFVSLMLCGMLAIASTWTGSASQLTLVIACGSVFAGVSLPCPWAASIDMGGRNAALVMGLMNSAGCLAGIFISPLIGRLIDHIKLTNGNWDMAVFVHAGFYLLSAVLWLAVTPDKLIGQSPQKATDV
jgi:sugar phosphate permease